ncbi:MAG: hypothetical protein WAO95_17595 [Burkholderiales bacterium]
MARADQQIVYGEMQVDAVCESLRQRLMGHANRRNIGTGILHGVNAHGAHSPLDFDGESSSMLANSRIVEQLVYEMQRGAIAMDAPDWRARMEAYCARAYAEDRLPICLAHMKYNRPTRRFWAAVESHRRGGREFAAPASAKGLIDEHELFVAAALPRTEFDVIVPRPPVHRGLAVSFILAPEMVILHGTEIPGNVEIDFGDGTGLRKVALGEAVDIRYASPGRKELRLRAASGGRRLESAFALDVSVAVAPQPDEYWNLTADYPYKERGFEFYATGHAWVYFGSENGKKKNRMTRPIIVSEGFPGNYSIDYLWEVLNKQNLATDLLAQGHDLVVLGYANGTISIEGNAYVAVEAILRSQGSSTPLIVGGASMGGLITRYALTFMENAGIDHQTGKYFSVDSPHDGANIPAALQGFLQLYASQNDTSRQAAALLTTTAAKQMLRTWLPADYWYFHQPDNTFKEFWDKLSAIGWVPRRPRKAGVADGIGNGTGNGDVSGAMAVNWSKTIDYWGELYISPLGNTADQIVMRAKNKGAPNANGEVRILRPAGGLGFDGAPGGSTPAFQVLYDSLPGSIKTLTYGKACFIPTISACGLEDWGNLYLDVQGSPKPSILDTYMASTDANHNHVEITLELANFLKQFVAS